MLPTDRPDEAIIEDDARLDRWFEQFMRDTARKLAKRGGRPGGDPDLVFGREAPDDPRAQLVFAASQLK